MIADEALALARLIRGTRLWQVRFGPRNAGEESSSLNGFLLTDLARTSTA